MTESSAPKRSVLLLAGLLFAESVQTEVDALRSALTGQRFGCHERLGEDGSLVKENELMGVLHTELLHTLTKCLPVCKWITLSSPETQPPG